MSGFTIKTILVSHIYFNTAISSDPKDIHTAQNKSVDNLIDLNQLYNESEDVSATSSSSKEYFPLNINSKRQHFERTIEMEIKLTEKEHDFYETEAFVYRWEDVTKYPVPAHQQLWNKRCTELWPGIPGYELIPMFCIAKLYPMLETRGRGGARYKIYFHTTENYDPKSYYFQSDLIRCDCRYVKPELSQIGLQSATLPNTMKYFYALKYTDKEYFLMECLPGKKHLHLRIASFVEIH